MSDYLKSALLNHIFRNTAFIQPATIAVALCTAAPVDSDTGATIPEVVGGGYARKEIARADANWTLSTHSVDNTALTAFPAATGNWGTVTHIALLDNTIIGAGNILFHGPIDAPKIVGVGNTFEFNATQLVVQLD